MRRLRIVRAAHHVAVEIVLEDLDVLALDPGGHRHAGIRVQLVPVQAEELEPLAVEVEAIRPDPPNSSTSRVPSACGVTAESMEHSTSTRRCGLSTSAGMANRSERNACGTNRR